MKPFTKDSRTDEEKRVDKTLDAAKTVEDKSRRVDSETGEPVDNETVDPATVPGTPEYEEALRKTVETDQQRKAREKKEKEAESGKDTSVSTPAIGSFPR